MDFQTILFSILGTIITALASWATERLVSWLNTKIKNQKAAEYLNKALSIINSAVKATYQTYVEALKDKDVFTKEAQEEALTKAVEQVEVTMTKEVKNYIADNFGDLTEWIKLQIESTIYNLKNETKYTE